MANAKPEGRGCDECCLNDSLALLSTGHEVLPHARNNQLRELTARGPSPHVTRNTRRLSRQCDDDYDPKSNLDVLGISNI